MQAVDRTHAKARSVAAGEVGAEFESIFRYRSFLPYPCGLIASYVAIDILSDRCGNPAAKDLLGDGVEGFC
jgi:hypothetical protein